MPTDGPLTIWVHCPICGQLVDIDEYFAERACGHVIQNSPSGGTNVGYSLAATARNHTRAWGVPLQPKTVPALENADAD